MLMNIYHGSNHILKKPVLGYGHRYNDYGLGFYCTEDLTLAKEWAVRLNTDGYVNGYSLDTAGLKALDFNDGNHILMEWLAILISNREVDMNLPLQLEAKEYILKNFLIDISGYDLVRGYRADDSYFTFVRDFLRGSISYEQLGKAMVLGGLGEQLMIKSREAFDRLIFTGYTQVEASKWFNRSQSREIEAKRQYSQLHRGKDDLYIIDILRREMKRDELCLR